MPQSIVNLKTGAAVMKRLRAIHETPVTQRREKWGRGWGWEIVNGANRIRAEFPDLVPELDELQGAPKTLDDLTPIGHSFGV